MRTSPRTRLRRGVLAATLAAAPLAPLHAQEPSGLPDGIAPPASHVLHDLALPAPAAQLGGLLSTLDVGVSVGSVRTGRWYDAGGEPGTVKSGTAFAAEVRYWPVPWAGMRLQAGRFDGEIRTLGPPAYTGIPARPQALRGTVYDASIVVRPLATTPGVPVVLTTAYAFAGGGRVELEVSGRPDSVYICSETEDACAYRMPSSGTVGAVTAGVGADLVTVRGFTLFAEASLHRYRPPFTGQPNLLAQRNARGGVDPGAPARPAVGTPTAPAVVDEVVTRRLAAGVRRTFRIGEGPPPAPPPPPPSPTTGGVVSVRTDEPGAEVYLVPRSALEDNPGLRCRLRPVLARGSYFVGRTTGAQPLRVPAAPRAWVLIVRQQVPGAGGRVWHVYEQRVQLAGGRTLPVQLNMRRDGAPPPPCPR
jgi:hypothetical protein